MIRINTTGRGLWVALVITSVMAVKALAHHGWSEYDASKTLDFTGVIRESGYSHPHVLIKLQIDGANGKVWLVVLASPFAHEQPRADESDAQDRHYGQGRRLPAQAKS